VSVRVAFPLLGGAIWTGGQTYLRNLFRTLQTTAAERIMPVLMAPAGRSAAAHAAFSDIGELEILELPMALSNRLRSRAMAIFIGRDARLEHWLHANRIDVVFEATDFIGWRNRLPALVWMPDFQHRHFPGGFEWSRLWGRELLYQLQTRSGRTIMLSSEATRKECEEFYPAARGHTAVARFCVPAKPVVGEPDLTARYGLPRDYLFLPNQFWKHKNHGIIVDALRLLRDQGRKVAVVASGNPADVRNPSYFPALLERIARLELGDSWRLLGMIPYEDVLGLMRSSVAVVNPSLVEGWSTTVEEAKSLQVPLVLSDIPVHREQATRDVLFFDPHSADAVADALYKAFEQFKSRPRGSDRVVDPSCDARLRDFGSAFCDAVDLALERDRLLKRGTQR
jgi:glycosyltransferase involved in cell wall biosynthesis